MGVRIDRWVTLVWKDNTSYARGDKERVPRVWHLEKGGLAISVHRYVGCHDQWFVTCEPFFNVRPLQAKEVEAAKNEALALVRVRVKELASALGD